MDRGTWPAAVRGVTKESDSTEGLNSNDNKRLLCTRLLLGAPRIPGSLLWTQLFLHITALSLGNTQDPCDTEFQRKWANGSFQYKQVTLPGPEETTRLNADEVWPWPVRGLSPERKTAWFPSISRLKNRVHGLKSDRQGQRLLMYLVAQSCPSLCNSMDCSPPGSSFHGNSPGNYPQRVNSTKRGKGETPNPRADKQRPWSSMPDPPNPTHEATQPPGLGRDQTSPQCPAWPATTRQWDQGTPRRLETLSGGQRARMARRGPGQPHSGGQPTREVGEGVNRRP